MTARVVIVGGGHNALVAATYLARAGFETIVLERLPHVGGAAISATPFAGVDARLSRFSYLVSLMPEALIAELGLDLELRSRGTASYTPYVGPRGPAGLLIESIEGAPTRDSFRQLTGDDSEYEAWQTFYREVGSLAETIAPTLLDPLPHIGDIRDQVDMAIWTDIVEQPLGTAIERRFTNDLVRGVVATDALIGTFASMNASSLIQNRCFLYHLMGNGTGEWRVPVGGMGAVTRQLERVARAAGATIHTSTSVTAIDVRDDGATVRSADDTWEADWVLSGVAPYTLAELVGADSPAKPTGSQFKVNLLINRLPGLVSGDDPAVAFAGTLHLNESYTDIERAYADAANGQVPRRLPGEIYCHSLTDSSILGDADAQSGMHTLTYFGLHTPGNVVAAEELKSLAYERFVASLEAHLTEPLAGLLVHDAIGAPCVEIKTPNDVESELAMPGGHIFHGDLSWPWLEEGADHRTAAQRWGVATDHPRVLLAGSGAVRGGAVSGVAGHNAAHAILDFYQNRTD